MYVHISSAFCSCECGQHRHKTPVDVYLSVCRVAHARRLGLSPIVVGSLDQAMHEKCLEEGVPSIFLNGSSILQTGPVKYFNTGAQRPKPPAASSEKSPRPLLSS